MMDSIERMRRINDLTKELKQRGFAESSFEAIQQANQIYGNDDLDDNVKHGIIQNKQAEPLGKNTDVSGDAAPYADRKIAKLSDSVDVLTNKLNEIIRAINDLDARLTDLKTKQDKIITLVNQPRPEPREHVEPKVESRIEAQATQHEEAHDVSVESAPVKKDEYAMNQRTGSFQSQDVAIDKMFYFGKK
jgi:hypothetical protein